VTLSDIGHRRLEALEVLATDDRPVVVATLPLRIDSRANDHRSNHWGPRAERTKKHRTGAFMVLARHRTALRRLLASRGAVVRVVRCAPTELDGHDNLGMSLKAVSDGVADVFGVNDRDERLHLVPDSEAGPWGVRIEVYEGTR
jgi:hypothetical protein